MPGPFHFKQFSINQERCAMKVSEIACLFGAWVPIPPDAKRILDIGSGTGLLGLMLAQRSRALIDCIEIDTEAWKQSLENIQASQFADRIAVYNLDILQFNSAHFYDVIVCNPPFFENQLPAIDRQKNLAWHSSALRLSNLLPTTKRLLATRGRLGILLPVSRLTECEQLALKEGLYLQKVLYVRHSGKHPVRHVMMLFNQEQHPTDSKEMVIHDEAVYSSGFRELLKPYYLKL